MRHALLLNLLILLFSLFAAAQSGQGPEDSLPTAGVDGSKNPEAISDINAQLVWLLAASPSASDSAVEQAARQAYQQQALKVDAANAAKLNTLLRDFSSQHDALAADYNASAPSISRDELWREYRNFRNKENDLVAVTVRAINDQFPAAAAQFTSTVQEAKRSMQLSFYRSSTNPDYITNPRTAVTGFAYIQGAVSATSSSGKPTRYQTVLIVGMVPGCPGKVLPKLLNIVGGNAGWTEGPKFSPVEYMSFQNTQSGPANEKKTQAAQLVVCELGGNRGQ